MKKLKILFSLLLSFLLLISMFGVLGCSCSDGEENSEDEGKVQTNILYTDFEATDFKEWSPVFQLLKCTRNSGAAEINTNPEFSVKGEAGKKQSCLFRPLGSASDKLDARYIFPFYSEMCDFDYRDLSVIRDLTAEFYNAEDSEIEVGFGIVPTLSSITNYTTVKEKKIKLAPQQWTSVIYEVDQNAISTLYDISNIYGFYISFSAIDSLDIEDAPKIYMDDIYINKYKVAMPKAEGLTLKGLELLDFEDLMQNESIEIVGDAYNKPEGGIVKASDYGITSVSGENVYQMKFNPGVDASAERYSRFNIVKNTVNISAAGSLATDELQNLVLVFNIYNDQDVQEIITLAVYGDKTSNRYAQNLRLKPKQWNSIHLSMKELLIKVPEFGKGTKNHIRFYMREFTGDAKTFYLDNLHYEWASNLNATINN